MTSWFAHSHPSVPQERWQPLYDHLSAVGERAARAAAKFGAEDLGRVTGLLHDLGKYSPAFQARLRGAERRVDHSSAGAIFAAERYALAQAPVLGRMIAAAVAGHHAGLANGSGDGERSTLEARLALTFDRELPALDPAWTGEVELPNTLTIPIHDLGPHSERAGFQAAFLVRMLFSCLVDADYLDTEAWYASIEGACPPRGEWPNLHELKAALDGYLTRKQQASPRTAVNAARGEVLAAARAAAGARSGLFSLTVPTGGGKTLSALAFALDHALRWQLQRIIYVAPFTSIIEQNAQAFRDALAPHGDAVLEHHSAFREDALLCERRGQPGEQGPEAAEKLKLAMENWDVPVIATTAVQFFESLFAATPARCRKLHNIARSVVILDEAQTLPLDFLRPCLAAVDALARNFGASVVLCTATQPAIEERPDAPKRSFHGGLSDVRSIVSDDHRDRLFSRLCRVHVVKRTDALDDEALTRLLREREQVLCIVNTRRHARALFQTLSTETGSRHLSTWMCAQHRAKVLDAVRADLGAGRPCRVISTSLVEAGVDVDFPSVFRAESGLDSIAQAAGRCNREGRRGAAESIVCVFRPADWPPPPEIAQFASAARSILRRHEDVLAPPAVEAYFREVYWLRSAGRDDELDRNGIIERLNERAREGLFPFEWVEKTFRIIRSAEQPIIVPYDDHAREQLARLRNAKRVGPIARKLQRYIVPVHPGLFAKLCAGGAVVPVREDSDMGQFFELVNPDLYREGVGLVWDDPHVLAAERLVF